MAQTEFLAASARFEKDLITFAQEIVRICSYSSQEGELAHFIRDKFEQLGYDEAYIDSIGNVVGRLGDGPVSLLLDSHMDTVEVLDPEKWTKPPFGGEIHDGRLYGRGAVDMKGALASSVYGPLIARDLGWLDGHTVYVTCTVNEEDCDGECLLSLFKEKNLRPDYYVTCEPSSNEIALGHTGKAQVRITTKGVSAAAARPHNGVNAVYKMAPIITRIETLMQDLAASGDPHGTVTISEISSESASLNAVPSECTIEIDRRTVIGETEADVRRQFDEVVEGTDAAWEISIVHAKSWTGQDIEYAPLHEAWMIDIDHPLAQASRDAYQAVYGKPHSDQYHVWVAGSNAVAPVSLGIPSIGFGPGEDFLSHTSDENCIVEEIVFAAQFYAQLIRRL